MYKDKIYFENWLLKKELSELELNALCEAIYDTEKGEVCMDNITDVKSINEELEDQLITVNSQFTDIEDLKSERDTLTDTCERLKSKLNRIEEILTERK